MARALSDDGDVSPVPPLDALRRSTEAVRAAFSGLDAQALARRPAPTAWSAWDIAYHVAQIEVWYAAKICEAADDPAEALRRFLGLWSAMRAAALTIAQAIPDGRLDVPGLLGGVPDWTPRQLLERIAAHDQEHAAQVREAADSGG